MNEIINIEHNNERVLTTEQLAQAYGCETKRISENFKRNEERFKEGKHYFKLDGDALRDFKITNPQIADNLKFAPVIMLWTRRGASRHSKMLGTDKAWEMFDALEENYFNPRGRHNYYISPKLFMDYTGFTEADILQRAAQEGVQL